MDKILEELKQTNRRVDVGKVICKVCWLSVSGRCGVMEQGCRELPGYIKEIDGLYGD